MAFVASVMAMAQVTTSSLAGIVTDDMGEVVGATVQAIHTPSGTHYGTITNDKGAFAIRGMRVGGPYEIIVSYVGAQTQKFEDVTLALGETFNLNVKLSENADVLGEVVVVGSGSKFAHAQTGAATNINSSALTNMPTVSRSITEFTRLSPYGGNGMSFGGADGRTANFTIDGANFNNNFGLSSNLPGGGNPVSIDAIEEMQVVISPYDVRQTGFVGGGVNAITKSGTNEFKGSAYVYHKNENMRGDAIEREQILNTREKDQQTTWGFTLGGPIIKNKLFFFANAEWIKTPTIANRWRGSEITNGVAGQMNPGVADPDNYISRSSNFDLKQVSDFVKFNTTDGTWQTGTAAYDKRGVEAFVPVWNVENCIQCNKCSFCCPHGCIRPFVLDEQEAAGFDGETQDILAPKAIKGMKFRMEVSVLDCLGCGNCVDVCPGKKNKETGKVEKALKMVPFNVDDPAMKKEVDNWTYLVKNVKSKQDLIDIKQSPKNSQFADTLFEFSGACAGCGETPYVKLISQLFGDREMIANATGCSSIYSASVPSTPYCKNDKGQGPAFNNSLFEDFCEFGLGMSLANKKMKERICHLLNEAKGNENVPEEFVAAADNWMANMNDADGSKAAAAELKPLIAAGAEKGCPICAELKTLDHYLVKRSQWIIGGDGASYDIGYGGLDHVLSTGEDVNILVLDTEVYSNTGGQSSKSTPIGAIAQFAASGKRVSKKDLGLMETTYGYIYVAQIAMGADNAQTLKAIREAEAYPGPSLVIAYAPCINHGIKGTKEEKRNMGRSQHEEALAVECGYWHLWRFNPELAKEGKNPFQLDSKAPQWDKFQDYLMGEVRFSSLKKADPEHAEELFSETEKSAKRRYQAYVRKSQEDWTEII